jgi:hypothetical protein
MRPTVQREAGPGDVFEPDRTFFELGVILCDVCVLPFPSCFGSVVGPSTRFGSEVTSSVCLMRYGRHQMFDA